MPPKANPNQYPSSPFLKISIDPRKTAILALASSALLSAAATVAANLPGDRGTDPVLAQTTFSSPSHYATLGIGGQDIFPGVPSFNLPGARVDVTHESDPKTPARTVTSIVTYKDKISMEWARLIEQDPKAGEVQSGDDSFRRIAAAVRMYQSMGIPLSDIGIELHGHSSPEDETILKPGCTNTGFGNRSQRNDNLAKMRPEKASPQLAAYLTPEFGPSIANQIVVTGGDEVENPKQQAMMEHVARSRGMCPRDLVLGYNAGKIKLAPHELKVMKEGLDDNRRVDVLIRAIRTEVLPGEDTPPRQVGALVLILFGVPIPKVRSAIRTIPAMPPKQPPTAGRTLPQTAHKMRPRPGYQKAPKPIKQPNVVNDGGNYARRSKRTNRS